MPALDAFLQQKLELLAARHARRELRATGRGQGATVTRDGKSLISFSDNDYLGLSRHPEVLAAAAEALTRYGTGAAASRLVTGTHEAYAALESALANYKGTQSALVFGSGYLANLGTIPAIVGKGDLILADRLSHACMLDGARLSGATVMRYSHNNLDHARMLLEEHRAEHHHCLLITETVFSMDGDRAPLSALSTLCHEFDAWLMTDDAHGLGVLPREKNPADIQMGTLSKAAGGYGGYVCASRTCTDYLATTARSMMFSTGLPPASVAAATAALSIIAAEPELVAKPLANARRFTAALGLEPAQSAIVPLVLRENDKTLAAARELEEEGFLVAAIRPPTVPEGTARLRFAFSALHTDAQIDALAAIIRKKEWLCAQPA